MNRDEMSPELKALLDATPVLRESDLKELADANRALAHDPEFIADCIKGDFVNAILSEMQEQGINKNQLAIKWGKSRQHISQILDQEKSKNFTIDTIVSLSMTLGLIPQRIELKKLTPNAVPIRMKRLEFFSDWDWSPLWCAPEGSTCKCQHVAESRGPEYHAISPENQKLELAA